MKHPINNFYLDFKDHKWEMDIIVDFDKVGFHYSETAESPGEEPKLEINDIHFKTKKNLSLLESRIKTELEDKYQADLWEAWEERK